MLKRLYVNNYKSLVNFELNFNRLNLYLGVNGSGKSTVFEVLNTLQRFLIHKEKVDELFPFLSLTRWVTSDEQTFELVLDSDGGQYRYKLVIEHERQRHRQRVKSERLQWDNQLLLEFQEGTAQLFRDDGSTGPAYPFDWNQSAIGSLPERHDNQKLTAFKKQLSRMMIVQPTPLLIENQSYDEQAFPSYYLENFVSWYRMLSGTTRFVVALDNDLKAMLPDFDALELSRGPDPKSLNISFRTEGGKSVQFDLLELSEGQRMLIILYCFLHLSEHYRDYSLILCFDEPDNYVALQEIQPWLQALYDQTATGNTQVLMISHHPEVVNYLLMPSSEPVGVLFERDGSLAPTRVQPVDTQAYKELGLPMSELVARGWLTNE